MFEESQSGFSFGRPTTVLSTLNTIQMHIEPDQSYEEALKIPRRQDFIECKCPNGSALPSSKKGEC